jgi:uncharacterized protein YjbJ (UPF0337 family)
MVEFNQHRQGHRQGQCYAIFKKVVVRTACLVMVTVAVWAGFWMPHAVAAGSREAGSVMNERAAAELDRMSGAGTSDQLQGNVERTVGKAKRGMGRMADSVNDASSRDLGDKLGNRLNNAADRLDGSAKELNGKMKRDIGRAKGAAAAAGDKAEGKAQGVVESIKDLFD